MLLLHWWLLLCCHNSRKMTDIQRWACYCYTGDCCYVVTTVENMRFWATQHYTPCRYQCDSCGSREFIYLFFILNIKKEQDQVLTKTPLQCHLAGVWVFMFFSCNSAAPYCQLVRSLPRSIRPGQLITLLSLKLSWPGTRGYNLPCGHQQNRSVSETNHGLQDRHGIPYTITMLRTALFSFSF